MDSLIQDIQPFVIEYGLKLIAAIAIFVIGKWVAKMVRRLLERIAKKAEWDTTLISFVGNLTYAGMMVFVILAALGQIGVETTSFIAVLGAAGLAIGLSLQGSLSNFAAGFMMILFKPFKVGDLVEIASTLGTVEEIQIFTTRMRTGDNKTIYIPNGQIMDGTIINYSTKNTRRIDMVFGIGYDDDLQKAKDLINQILKEDERIFTDPAPTVGVAELADSSVNFAVRPWVKSGDYWPVFFHLNETIKLRFDAAGISIPYPQQDLHLVSGVPSAAG